MAEETAAAPAPAKKAAAKKPAAKKAKPAHPKTSQMVADAIKALKDRKGSSLAAIKKHIVANNKVDADKISPFIRRYIKKAVLDGTLVQTKGVGANGSFKLAAAPKPEKKKAAAPKKKKPATPKKAPAKKKAVTPKKKKVVKKTATKSKKEKKPAKSPKKPKAPKPKKAASKPKAKKAAPKKK